MKKIILASASPRRKELLGKVEPGLRRKCIVDVLHLRYAIELGVRDLGYEIVEW